MKQYSFGHYKQKKNSSFVKKLGQWDNKKQNLKVDRW